MVLFQKPTQDVIQTFIGQESSRPFSYSAVGATRIPTPPAAYVVDHNRVCLGSGFETFIRAKAALRRWEMFNLRWVQLCWPETPPVANTTVAILVRAWGLWFLNAVRIVYVIEETGPIERFGFAYGTLHRPCRTGRGAIYGGVASGR